MNTKIIRKNLSAMVAERLLEQIACGHYKLLEKLPVENELMELFGVGRSTIREAIKILENAGRVRVRQGSGTFVDPFPGSIANLTSLMQSAGEGDKNEIAEMLERQVVKHVIRNRQEIDVMLIKRIYEQQMKAASLPEDWNNWIKMVYHFKEIVAGFCKNKILRELYLIIADEQRKLIAEKSNDNDLVVKINGLHQSILEQICASPILFRKNS